MNSTNEIIKNCPLCGQPPEIFDCEDPVLRVFCKNHKCWLYRYFVPLPFWNDRFVEPVGWLPVWNMPSGVSGPYVVQTSEFGFKPTLAIAYCWMGSKNSVPKWYLDEATYHLERPYEIAETVAWYLPIPKNEKKS